MLARVDVTDQGGASLSDAPLSAPLARTQVFDALDGEAQALVRQVIARNLPRT